MRVRRRNPDRVDEVTGPLDVAALLAHLEVNPTTVLVILDGNLVTSATVLSDEADVEIRPVISGGAGPSRCHDCRGPAVIEEPRHRSAWCGEHFVDHVHRQIRKAIDHDRMFSYNDRILLAVSGGKDSLALWDALLTMGYGADGLYIGLGIGGYSKRSGRVCAEFAAKRGVELITVDLQEAYGYTTPSGSQASGRTTCGVCGLSKRYVFNRVAVEGGYDVVVTGHNLDDEAAVLLNNVLHWHEDFLARQRPLLPATGPNQVRKAKPLYRLSEREMAAYCVLRGIDYVVEECPLVDGNTGQEHKETLSALEAGSPGAKAQFLFGFLDRAEQLFPRRDDATAVALGECQTCGMPTTAAVCAFCKQRTRILVDLQGDPTGPAAAARQLPIVSTS